MLLKRTNRLRGILQSFLLIIVLIFYGCANRSSPTGGPRDEEPPSLVTSLPTTGTTNFRDQEIVLEFDEDVKLNKAKEQIIITPRLSGDFDIKAKREKIVISFDSAFSDNTTYTINFRESIVDLTEGNPAENLSIAFSTGDYIDSLSISGFIQNVQAGTPSKQATIALYFADDTTSVLNALPVYFTETNDSGRYIIKNLKSARYRAYAFKDANRNLELETGSETYGFYPDTLLVNQDITDINMNMVFLDISEFKLISARPVGTTFDIRLNKYITDYTVIPADTTITLSHYYADPDRETISVFNTKQFSDSTLIYLSATDSIQQSIADTLWVKFSNSSRKPDDLTSQLLIKPIPVNKPVLNATLTFSKPIRQINSDSVYIYLDSLHQIPYDSLRTTWNPFRTDLSISYSFPDSLFRRNTTNDNPSPGTSVNRQPSLNLGRSAFISVEDDSTKARSESLSFVQPTSLGVLIFNISSSTSEYFIELIDSKGTVVATHPPAPTIRFSQLPPGDYSLRAIIDVNQNGKWDPGNILENQLPENIVYFRARDGSRIISLRANFEITESFNF